MVDAPAMPSRRTLIAAAVGALTLTGVAVSGVTAGGSPDVGKAAPAFTGTTADGETISLGDYKGKTVILEWTNHQCPYVRKHYGADNMQALQRKTTTDGAVWLSVISSAPGTQGYVEPAEALKIAETRGASPSEIVLDPEGSIGRAYGARTTPHMYIIDGNGTLVYKGGIDDRPTTNPADIERATNYVRAALDDMAAGKPVAQPVTRAYGCSVKYSS